MPKAKITILIGPKIGVKAVYSGEVYETIMIAERPKKEVIKPSKEKSVNAIHRVQITHGNREKQKYPYSMKKRTPKSSRF